MPGQNLSETRATGNDTKASRKRKPRRKNIHFLICCAIINMNAFSGRLLRKTENSGRYFALFCDNVRNIGSRN